MIIFLIIAGALLLLFLFWKIFKIPKVGCIGMVTGGVKCGKSMLSVWLAVRKYKSQIRKWWLKKTLIILVNKLFRKTFAVPEKPLLYSNVKLAGVHYTPLTTDMILRKERVAFKSVVYIQEASLLADSMYFSDKTVNERLLLFNKLYGHESHGGYLIYDTQSISDNHYAVKRCINSYFWIHHNVKIPFFVLLYVREFMYSEDKSAVNTVESDVEEGLKIIVVPKRVWRMYDAYCYSAFTDDLPKREDDRFARIPANPFNRADLKTRRLISLKKFATIDEYRVSREEELNDKRSKK